MRYGRELPGYPFNLKAFLTRCIICSQRKIFGEYLRKWSPLASLEVDAKGDAANQMIYEAVQSKGPLLITRFGCGEMETTLRGFDIKESSGHRFRAAINMLLGASGPFWWDNSIRGGIVWMCGYFPPTDEDLMKFAEKLFVDSRQIDILASFLVGEKRLSKRFFPNVKSFPLWDYEPFWFQNPWTRSLKGKKVLVVHPFVDTIRMQYEKREKLFRNNEMLPEFDLITYRAVSSFAGNKTEYRTWFDALKKMSDDISQIDFDVALIGCGAYGMPLGAFIKRDLRKKALHTAGITQLFFGIKGGRWDEIEKYRTELYNEHWVRPLESDTVQAFRTIERGCYW